MEDHWDSNSLIPFDWEESPSTSVSPDFSPVDSLSEFPPTPEQVNYPNLFPSEVNALHTDPYFAASPSISPYSEYAMQQIPPYVDPSHYGYAKYPSIPPIIQQRSPTPDIPQNINHFSATPMHHRQSRNRATATYLSADGMSPSGYSINALANPSAQVQPPFAFHIRLCVPTMNDSRTPPTFPDYNQQPRC